LADLVDLYVVYDEAPTGAYKLRGEEYSRDPTQILHWAKKSREDEPLDLLLKKRCLIAGQPATRHALFERRRRSSIEPWDHHAVTYPLQNLPARS
jgi:hypothetical protein